MRAAQRQPHRDRLLDRLAVGDRQHARLRRQTGQMCVFGAPP